MPRLGMDIEQVRTTAGRMDTKADEIMTIWTELNGVLSGTDWAGQDRNRFVDDWQGVHRNQMQAVCDAVKEAARVARSNADEQERTSNN